MRILVADKLAEEGLEFLKNSKADFDVKVGLKEDELAAAVGEYDALIVRSGAKVTAKVLDNPGKLKAIARAGVGVDNIDLEAATAKGILVLNTAEASTLSTAEHALALMMSLARKIPAGASVPQVRPAGMEKTQPVSGHATGRQDAGRRRAWAASAEPSPRRALAMEMNVVGFDPFFSAADRSGRQGETRSAISTNSSARSMSSPSTFPAAKRPSICSTAIGCSTSAGRICWSSTMPAAKWWMNSRWPMR